MTTTATTPPGARTALGAGITPAELGELVAAFNEVTSRLQASHEQLRADVARLTRELGEANEALERSRRLAALGEIAAGIAHEVRNPLGSIRLYARMLEQDLHDRPGERAIATKIAGAASGLEGVVGDVLTFSREMKVRPAPIDATEAFDRALDACRHDEGAWRAVEVVRDDRRRVSEFEADPALLHQALVNVIRNAFEAMAEHPSPPRRLTLNAQAGTMIEISGRRRRGTKLTISDTGPGVTPQVMERMFNPFYTTRGSGTGLGLAIVHRIVDAHAGRVTVRNNSDLGGGPGATVEFLLPRGSAGASSEPARTCTEAG